MPRSPLFLALCPVFVLLALARNPLAAQELVRPEWDYGIASGLNWLAVSVQPGVAIGPHQLFWRASLGGFLLNHQEEKSYRLQIGYQYKIFKFQIGIERNSINALLDYGPSQSVYHGFGLQLDWRNSSELIHLSLRSTLAEMSSNRFPTRTVMVNRLASRLLLMQQPPTQLALQGSTDLIIDLTDNGNKLAAALSFPFTTQLLAQPKITLQLQPQLAHVQLTTRQAEGGILDDLIARPNQEQQATSLAKLTTEGRLYPLSSSSTAILQDVFVALRFDMGLYHLDPNPLTQTFFDYRIGGLLGWEEFGGEKNKGAIGLQLDFNPRDQWRLGFVVNGQW